MAHFDTRSSHSGVCALSIATVVCVVCLSPERSRAGAWAREDMGLYAKLSTSYAYATQQYKETGDTFQLLSEDEDGHYQSTAIFLYAEYGLLPSLTLTFSGAFMSSVVESDLVRIRTTGTSDLNLGAKYQILDKPFVLSVGAVSRIPTGYTPDPSAAKAPTLGVGVTAWEGNLQIGKSFYPVPLYVSGRFGFRYRGARTSREGDEIDYPPELPYAAEVGYTPLEWLTVRARLDGVHGLGDPEALDAFTLSPLTQSYLNIGPSVIFKWPDPLQIDVGYRYTVTGVNAVASHVATLGLAVDTTL